MRGGSGQLLALPPQPQRLRRRRIRRRGRQPQLALVLRLYEAEIRDLQVTRDDTLNRKGETPLLERI